MKRSLIGIVAVVSVTGLAIAYLVFSSTPWNSLHVSGAFETGRSHPEYGPIYITRAVDPGLLHPSRRPARMQMWRLRHTLRASLGLPGPPPLPGVIHLHIGPHQMDASAGHPHQGAGWLSFYQPETNTPVWEFAPGGTVQVEEVSDSDLGGAFDSARSAGTEGVLAADSGGRVIRVRPGELYFARHIADTNRVYAIEIANLEIGVLVAKYVMVEVGVDRTMSMPR